MAKRKAVGEQTEAKNSMELDIDEENDDNESIIDVDFEFFGLNPTIDFHGLKTLLKQLFDVDNESIDLSELADLLLAQADHVGTAVKCDGEETDPYAFISVLNLAMHKDRNVLKQLTEYLISRTAGIAGLDKLLRPDGDAKLGLVFSERFINMPHQVVPPLYGMLQREMAQGGEDFDFSHLIVLSKTYTEVESKLDVEDDRPAKKTKSQRKAGEVFYFHPEDEVLQRFAMASGGFDYERSGDEGRSDSKRAFQEVGVKPLGHIIVLEKSKLDEAVKTVTEYLNSS